MSAAQGEPREAPALRVTVLATHPIQYHAPWFRALAALAEIELEVLFEYLPGPGAQGEGFGQPFAWDVPLLEGYRHRVLVDAPRVRSRVAALRALRKRLAETGPDVVVLTGWQSAVLLAATTMVRRAGARSLVRGDSNLLVPRPGWIRAAHRMLLRRFDGFLAVGTANRDFYLANGVPADRIFCCPYLVDNERFARSAREAGRMAARARFEVPADAACFLFAGRLDADKRAPDLVEALTGLGSSPVHVLIAGSGAQGPRLRRMARGLPVTFTGFLNQTQMPAAYAAADCLVLPSQYEPWGLVVNEAMACGVPAIVSDRVGCAPDLVIGGQTGWVFPCGDVRALAACMREAAADPLRLAAMGRTARDRVVEHHSPERAARAVLAASRVVCGAMAAG